MKKDTETKAGNATFPSLKILIACAMLAAISFVIGWICKTYMTFGAIRVTFENMPIIVSGIVFGPVCGTLVGIFSDILSCVGSGYSINPVITAGSAAVGLTAGIISNYVIKKDCVPRVIVSVFSAHIIGSMIIKSLGLYMMGYAFGVILYRVPLYLGIAAVEFYLIYMLLKNNAIKKEINRLKS